MTNRNCSRAAWTVRLLCSTALSLVLPSITYANPTDGQVAAGSATIAKTNPQTLTINQTTQKAVINWHSFSIGQGETTNFIQPGASSITLNRVTGIDPSSVMGNLSANGQVWLINPNGVAFGKSARVDVAGLLATTIDIADRDFMSGNYRFSGLNNPSAMVTNAGQITVRNAGLAALIAPGVENSGLIQANLGQIQLSSAAAFTVDLYGDGLFNFALDKQVTQRIQKPDGTKSTVAVSNSGQLIANGGRILLTANAAKAVVDKSINMDGYIQAMSASVSTAGEIILDGGSEGTVQVAGTIDASGNGAGQIGGTVHVSGQDVQLAPTATVDVSGDAGGGTALIGGDMHGSGTLRRASTITVAQGARINADALSKGTGGTVVVWSDDHTEYQGTTSARGGVSGGNGGSAEVSGHRFLDYQGTVDLRSSTGSIGTLLLDPEDVTIEDVGDAPSLSGSPSGPITLSPNTDDSILSVSTLTNALALADVTVSTGMSGNQAGDISVLGTIHWNGVNSLTLSAYRTITIGDGVSVTNTGSGNLTLRADNTGTGVGTTVFAGTGAVDWSASTGLVSVYYNPDSNPAGSVVNANSYRFPTNYGQWIAANPAVSKQVTSYMLVNTVYDLQNIQNETGGWNWGGNYGYALGRDIDASSTATWNGGLGFHPIGGGTTCCDGSTVFSSILDGLGHTINGLTINYSINSVGLIAANGGTVKNIGLTFLSINSQTYAAGGIAGSNSAAINMGTQTLPAGTISNSYVTGSIVANGGGGLVGLNDGIIASSYSSASVSGSGDYYGGLVGTNYGTITDSHAIGAVYGQYSGGLVGSNGSPTVGGAGGSIINSFATGAVGNGGSSVVGGLVAWNHGGSVTGSYATGTVAGSSVVGGLIGWNDDGTISSSYASGAVVGSYADGGLVGSDNGGIFTNAYWDTQSTGQAQSAGSGPAGLTTAQLKAGLPTGFDPSNWALSATINSGYPYLTTSSTGGGGRPPAVTVYFARPASVTLTWNVADTSSTYGDLATLGDVTLIGVLPADAGKISGAVGLFNGGMQVTLSQSLAAGKYSEQVIGLSGSVAGYYTLALTGNIAGTLTVNAPLPTAKSINWSIADATSTYGTLATLGAVTLTGISVADQGSVDGTVGLFSGNTRVMLSPSLAAGTYSEAVVALTGSAANNYTLSSTGNTSGTLTINPAQLSVVMNSASRLYGDTNPTFGASITGLLLGDSPSVVSGLTFSTPATSSSAVGNYAITSSGGTALNYVISSRTDSTLTISPKVLSWSVGNASSTYGTTPNLGGATLVGIVGSDEVSGSVALFNGSTQVMPTYFLDAGTYAEKVVSLNGAAASNYALSQTGGGTLTVAPKIVDWSVANATFDYGTYPTLGSATLFGIVSIDDVHGIVSLASTTPLSSTMAVGTYAEYASGLGGAKARDYVIASIGSYGTLSITQPSGFSSVVSQTSSQQNTGQTLPLAPIGTLAAYQFDAGSLVAPNTLDQIAMNFTTANSTPATAQTYYIQSGTGAMVTADQIRSGSFPTGTYFIEAATGKKVTQAELGSGSQQSNAAVSASAGATTGSTSTTLIQQAENLVSPIAKNAPISSDPMFIELLQSLGLNTHYDTIGGYISPKNYPSWNQQCVALVAALANITGATNTWWPKANGNVVTSAGTANSLKPGTPIGTFTGNQYNSAHSAIFVGYHYNTSVSPHAVDGMYIIDQYNLAQIGEKNPTSGAKPAEFRLYMFADSAAASSYYAIQIGPSH